MEEQNENGWKRTSGSSYSMQLAPSVKLEVGFGRRSITVDYSRMGAKGPEYQESAVYDRKKATVTTVIDKRQPSGKVHSVENKEPVNILENKDKFNLSGMTERDGRLARLVMKFIDEEEFKK